MCGHDTSSVEQLNGDGASKRGDSGSKTAFESQMGKTVRAGDEAHTGNNSTRAVWTGRILFVICLSAVAAALGYTAHYVISQSETTLAETQFRSIADRALTEAVGVAHQRRWAAATFASMVSEMLPNADEWPFVYVTGFERIISNLLAASAGKDMGFVPFVQPEEREEWESFAYDYYYNVRDPPFPNGTGQSSFGRGIWAINTTLGSPDDRYHDTTGETAYNSPNQILTPVFHTDEGVNPLLMFNVHFQATRGFAIDDMIQCSEDRHERLELLQQQGGEVDESEADALECGIITGMINNVKHGNVPSAAVFSPIYPANNRTTIVGFIPSVLLFHDVLEDIFADEVSGVDCVLETETEALTYTVTDGVAHLVGEGDLHDRSYDRFRQSALLTGQGMYTKNSPNYTLSVYPNEELYNVYSTTSPTFATVGVVCTIVVTSLFFFLYDFFVRREFHAKRELLEAKRVFMRFVSHEVRTPLNTVCMGLTLLQEEIAAAIGLGESSDDVQKHHTASTNPTPKKTVVKSDEIVNWLELSQQVLTNAQTSVDVLNDILNYDKIERGRLNLEISVVPVWALIDRTLEEFTLSASQKKINYIKDYEECIDGEMSPLDIMELPDSVANSKAVGDAVRITQVLRNLVSNAVKFTPEEGTLTVRSVRRKLDSNEKMRPKAQDFMLSNGDKVSYTQDAVLEVTVSDTGAGMTEEQLERLFSEGVQFNVNTLQDGHGSGLGLYIAKGIIKQHNCTLTVSSKGLNQGTTFTVSLPLFHVPALRHTEGSEAFASTSTAAEPLPLKILVVDDAPLNRKLLLHLLTKRGHDCDSAQDGQEAVDYVKQVMKEGTRYDTILMDYEMPVKNGPTAAKEIRGLGCDSFIVGITGNVLPEDIDYFKSSGANTVLPKPFRVPDLEELWVEYGVTGKSKNENQGSVEISELKGRLPLAN